MINIIIINILKMIPKSIIPLLVYFIIFLTFFSVNMLKEAQGINEITKKQ